jgi:hypothetical protein
MLLVEFLAYHASFSLKPQIPLEPGIIEWLKAVIRLFGAYSRTAIHPQEIFYPTWRVFRAVPGWRSEAAFLTG